MTSTEIAWVELIRAARKWAGHMDQFERISFDTPHGRVFLALDREVSHPMAFPLVDEHGDPVQPPEDV